MKIILFTEPRSWLEYLEMLRAIVQRRGCLQLRYRMGQMSWNMESTGGAYSSGSQSKDGGFEGSLSFISLPFRAS